MDAAADAYPRANNDRVMVAILVCIVDGCRLNRDPMPDIYLY